MATETPPALPEDVRGLIERLNTVSRESRYDIMPSVRAMMHEAADVLQRLHRPVPSRETMEALRRADAIISNGNGRGGRKLTFDFEKPEHEEAAHSAIFALFNQETTDHVGEGESE